MAQSEKEIELQYDNGKLRTYAKQLEKSNKDLMNIVRDLMSPSSGGASYFITLQIANKVLKEAESISLI